METALYLLPVTLGDTPIETVLPSYNKEIILGISHFIVEDVRSARRFLKKVDREIDIDTLTFYPLNKHTSPEDISGYLKPLMAGLSMGVISEAGCPAVADPGADVVAIAQRKNLKVVPLVGPSSIIRPQTNICIAANMTCEGEDIKTKTVMEGQGKVPDLSKIPCIFLLYK